MKKYVIALATIPLMFASCEKWTETESKAEEFEKVALGNLKEVRDQYKWVAEAERSVENKEALEAYWAQLREYKRRTWLNGGEAVGQKPMVYFWYSGGFWTAQKGVAKTWLQSIPDSVSCISFWGGLGMYPDKLTENQKKDLEIFHKKGSTVLMCWQTPSVGLGLPGSKDGKINGYNYFHQKYPFEECRTVWAEIYARELSRYIIAMGLDGYDVDWETCGDHGAVTEEGTPLMVNYDDLENSNISKFVREMAKYFGPVGEKHHVKTQAQREANLAALFNASTEGYHPNEKEFIEAFKPYLPENYLTKRYYFCADVPCEVPPIFGRNSQIPIPIELNSFAIYFDKHFMQDYTVNGVNMGGERPPMLGGPYYNSTSANYQAGNFKVLEGKAKDVKAGKVWGLGAYHGQTDFNINNENNEQFKDYLKRNNLTRNYKNYAWTREAIRIADPRPTYSDYKEMESYIITP